MSKINQKPNWQSENSDDFEVPQNDSENILENQEEFSVPGKNEPNLDINLIIASFQEKLSQLITEIVVKDATIKHLTNVMNNTKGNQ